MHSSHIIAEIAQLVEHNLAKVGVASSSLVFRSKNQANALRNASEGISVFGKYPAYWSKAYIKMWRFTFIGQKAYIN